MSYLEMSEEEIHNLVERGGLDDDMFFSLHTEALDELSKTETACNVNAEDCNEAEQILRNIIKEWSCSGDVFGAIQQAKEFLK